MEGAAQQSAPRTVQRIRLSDIRGCYQEFLLNRDAPLVIEGACSPWNATDVCTRLKTDFADRNTTWRIIPTTDNATFRENECDRVQASFGEFFAWVAGKRRPAAFDGLDPREVAAYADYKYMFELFDEDPVQLNWRMFGFDCPTSQSTFWVGSRGAHTPLHYDTYGVNIVAQLHGTKTWLLFPPEATSALHALRVPYEESSVYAEVDGRAMLADIRAQTWRVGETGLRPLVAEVSAGDILWVPRHYWHYVESVSDVTVSANLWVDIPEDVDARVEESLVRFLLGSIVGALDQTVMLGTCRWATSEEEEEILTDHETNANLMYSALSNWSLSNHGTLPTAHPTKLLQKLASSLLNPETIARLRRELTENLNS